MVTLDCSNNSYYALKQINEFKTAPQSNMFKMYNPQNININNAEVMCTLSFCDKYKNFIIKSLTVINKPYNKLNSTTRNMGMNKRIISNIHNTVILS
jgi:hypothetical protein